MASNHQTAAFLDITTDDARPTVRIDGTHYPLKLISDLSLADYKRLERLNLRLSPLLIAKSLGPKDEKELSSLLDEVCRIAIDAPTAVQDKLGDLHRLRIFQVFTNLLLPSLPKTRAAFGAGAATGSNGAKRSRGSAGSTAGTLRRGVRKSRSGSSAPVSH